MKASSLLGAATIALTLSFSQAAMASLKAVPLPRPRPVPEQMKPLPAPLPLTPEICVLSRLSIEVEHNEHEGFVKAAAPVYSIVNGLTSFCNTLEI